jgi:ankyrin repeat protein
MHYIRVDTQNALGAVTMTSTEHTPLGEFLATLLLPASKASSYLIRLSPSLVPHLQESDINGEYYGYSLLYLASQHQHGYQLALELLNKGAEVNSGRKETGETPLHCAATRGDNRLVRELIKQKAKVDARDSAGSMPLHHAKSYLVVVTLVKANAPTNAEDLDGSTPLHWAAQSSEPEIIEYLLSKGAKVNHPNKIGETPLHWAAYFNNQGAAKVLLKHNARIDARTEEGHLPIHSTCSETGKFLIEFGADKNNRRRRRGARGGAPVKASNKKCPRVDD